MPITKIKYLKSKETLKALELIFTQTNKQGYIEYGRLLASGGIGRKHIQHFLDQSWIEQVPSHRFYVNYRITERGEAELRARSQAAAEQRRRSAAAAEKYLDNKVTRKSLEYALTETKKHGHIEGKVLTARGVRPKHIEQFVDQGWMEQVTYRSIYLYYRITERGEAKLSARSQAEAEQPRKSTATAEQRPDEAGKPVRTSHRRKQDI